MSDHATEYRKMLVPASEVHGEYYSDSPWADEVEYQGPEHTADLIFLPHRDQWTRVGGVIREKESVIITFNDRDGNMQHPRWMPVEILRPVHQPPFDPGVSGVYR